MWLKVNTPGTRRLMVAEAGMKEPVEVSERGTFQVTKPVGKKLLAGLADVSEVDADEAGVEEEENVEDEAE